MNLRRALKHLAMPDWVVKRCFTASVVEGIERAIQASEYLHRGEVRFVIEAGLPLSALLADQTSRARAVELFSVLRVWDTAENSGVLIYVQGFDRQVEIVADRGVAAQVPQRAWEVICRQMEACFRDGRYEAGAVGAIAAVGGLLARHFPAREDNPNELPDRPLVL
ncbi:TPM domain-containing protein [Zoogloea sp.]|uniref:TPM domain-containing protein n=1 Tax=Zoogloea sp. TaxID=49181 RepID=UPI0026237D0D|nr:TPM domain-containing protein [Zoogloea sp.]MDD3355082.1 TPM domain-containing protein [Zoogloea sp.]